MNIGQQLDKVQRIKNKKQALEEKLRELKKELEAAEQEALTAMKEAGTTRAAGKLCSGSVSERFVVKVEDWDSVYGYVHKKKAFHLLHRRISSTAYKELLDDGKQVPGLKSDSVRVLSTTKAKGV